MEQMSTEELQAMRAKAAHELAELDRLLGLMTQQHGTYGRGDRVRVRGAGGAEAVLLVWEARERGLMLCSEDGYGRLQAGEEAPLIGFPYSNIVGKCHDDATASAP